MLKMAIQKNQTKGDSRHIVFKRIVCVFLLINTYGPFLKWGI
jgi:hypothetical protein